jgi:PAS domain S-box-containing protein
MTGASGTASSPQKSIVLADDDPMTLEAVTEVLNAEGYAVHAAQDGLEALALIRAVKPDYIILDVVLPKLDGGRVCAAVRQDARLRQTPIIAFSGLSPQEYRFFPQFSADAYVAKGRLPIAVQNLLTALSRFGECGRERMKGELLGYENFRSRQLVHDLLQEQRHLRAILRVFAPGALELDRAGRIVWANPGACEILGEKEVGLAGEAFAALVPGCDQREVQSLLAGLVQSEEPAQFVATLNLNGRQVTNRLATIMEDHVCTGLFVLVEDAVEGRGVRLESGYGKAE